MRKVCRGSRIASLERGGHCTFIVPSYDAEFDRERVAWERSQNRFEVCHGGKRTCIRRNDEVPLNEFGTCSGAIRGDTAHEETVTFAEADGTSHLFCNIGSCERNTESTIAR